MEFNITSPRPFIGLWRNFADGGRFTLTLPETEAGVLSSFLVIFAGIVALSGWNIVRFSLHQVRAADDLHDGLHHQLQAILRNSADLVQALQLIFRIGIAWRTRIGFARVARRLSGSFSIAIFFFCGLNLRPAFYFLDVVDGGRAVPCPDRQVRHLPPAGVAFRGRGIEPGGIHLRQEPTRGRHGLRAHVLR